MTRQVAEFDIEQSSDFDHEVTTFIKLHSSGQALLKDRVEIIIQNYFQSLDSNTEMSMGHDEEVSSEASISSNKKTLKGAELVEKIHQLLKNSDDWDGYGTPKVSDKLRDKCYEILEVICASQLELPLIFPVCGGGLQFEWKYGKRDLELEFNEETISVLRTEEISADEIMYLEKDNVSIDEIPVLIRWTENL